MKSTEMKDQDDSDHPDPPDHVGILGRNNPSHREQQDDAERQDAHAGILMERIDETLGMEVVAHPKGFGRSCGTAAADIDPTSH